MSKVENIYRMTPGAMIGGLIYFRLAIWSGSKEVFHIPVNSGQAGAQSLRAYPDKASIPGNMEPIPEGIYKVDPNLRWAGPSEDYATYWSPALGPVCVDLIAPKEGKVGYRGLFRIHLDANRAWAPGTAGCPGVIDMKDLKALVEAHNRYRPTSFIADYGFGSVPGPPNGKSSDKVSSEEIKKADPNSVTVTLKGVELDEARLWDGKVYIPATAIAKLMGSEVSWDGKTKTLDFKSSLSERIWAVESEIRQLKAKKS